MKYMNSGLFDKTVSHTFGEALVLIFMNKRDVQS